jgi:predicted RNA polymerase sigma factor
VTVYRTALAHGSRTSPSGEWLMMFAATLLADDVKAKSCWRRFTQQNRRPSRLRSYQLQAAIAAVHDEAAQADDTDWPQILALYDLLKRMYDNPMVMLNYAIAAAMVHGATKGLELLDALEADARLAEHHRLDAVRAHLLERAGDHTGAVEHYRAAAAKTRSIPERNYLLTQAARLSAGR